VKNAFINRQKTNTTCKYIGVRQERGRKEGKEREGEGEENRTEGKEREEKELKIF